MGDSLRKRSAIVHIDSESLGLGLALAEAAHARELALLLVCPTGMRPEDAAGLAEVIELPSLDLESLRRALNDIDARYEVLGINTVFGPFRPEGFLGGAVAHLRAERGLDGSCVEACYRATNKLLAREALDRAGVPNVRFALARDEASLALAAAHVGFPLLLKPLTGVGGSLIFRCDTWDEAVRSFERACAAIPAARYSQLRMAAHSFAEPEQAPREFAPASSMLVEEYIEGAEVSVECVVIADEVSALLVHDKIDVEERAATVLEHILVSPPQRFTAAQQSELKTYAERCVSALGLRNTLCHVELRYHAARGPLLLEVNPRIGAGCIEDSLRTFLGVDARGLQLDLLLGTAVPRDERPLTSSLHAMIFLFSPRSGTLRSVEGLERVLLLPGVKVVREMRPVGSVVGGDTEEEFVAGIWAEVPDVAAARALRAKINARVRIQVD